MPSYDPHDGEIWLPVPGAQETQADVPIGVDVLCDTNKVVHRVDMNTKCVNVSRLQASNMSRCIETSSIKYESMYRDLAARSIDVFEESR